MDTKIKNLKSGEALASQDKKQLTSCSAGGCRPRRGRRGGDAIPAVTTSPVTRGDAITNTEKYDNNNEYKKYSNDYSHTSFQYYEPVIERLLLCGIDSLDLGVYVDWGLARIGIVESLTRAKNAASGSKGLSWDDSKFGPCIITPNAIKKAYCFHLEYPGFHAFMFKRITQDNTPDIYISINAKTLWTLGPVASIQLIRDFVEAHGVTLKSIVPSRCDLTADFLIPAGICLPWFLDHMVPGSCKVRPWLAGCVLQTLYLGDPDSHTQARIYHKSAFEKGKDIEFFGELWKLDKPQNVWRFEFQLRRPALRTYGIESPEMLFERLGGLWRELTTDWLSLRALDDSNTSRRSILPLWEAVQAVAAQLGPSVAVERRVRQTGRAGPQWYVNRAASLLPGYAAPMGLQNLDDAVDGFAECIKDYWLSNYKDFNNAYTEKLVKAGLINKENNDVKDDIPF
mgnify:CR=1 FL=1